MKRGSRYLRYSSDGQSSHSIERQDIVTQQWMRYNNVELVDTFIDEGHSARTFDRPDIKKLLDFIKKNSHKIDYLIVSELTRFSRETGDAINMVKLIQNKYGVYIVSAGRGNIYDVNESNSFMMMGLEFLMGNSENIKRINDINGGIYTAKAKEGRHINGRVPFGYIKEGTGKHSTIVIDETKALAVKFVYDAYLRDWPLYTIKQKFAELGFPFKGHSYIQQMLANPIYSGQQQVKAWGKQPGGIFPAKHPAIIDLSTWHKVQEKMNAKESKTKTIIRDDFPLRSVLLCHCGLPLTGAPSKGKTNWYNYYKCKISGHNNFNADKAHTQLEEAFKYMSLPERLAQEVRKRSSILMEEQLKDDKRQLSSIKSELAKVQDQLQKVETKFINDQLDFETYNRWHQDLVNQRGSLNGKLQQLNRNYNEDFLVLEQNVSKLTDLEFAYRAMQPLEKQEFIKLVFDSKLYYQDKIYRTPYIMPILAHNAQILKEKRLLELKEKGFSFGKSSLVERTGIEPVIPP